MDVLIDAYPGMGTLGAEPEDSLAIALALVSPDHRAGHHVRRRQRAGASRYANAAHLLELLGQTDVPLAAGEERPLSGARRREPLRWLAERDAFDRILPVARLPFAVPHAVELILQTARASDGLTIVAIGPLTNVAAALVADPSLVHQLEAVVVIGGAFEVPGSISPTAPGGCGIRRLSSQHCVRVGDCGRRWWFGGLGAAGGRGPGLTSGRMVLVGASSDR
jgi:inosine-uridine nucleoside N-ribohydrolase